MSTARVALSVAAVTLTSVGIIQSAELSALDVQSSGIRAEYALPHLPERIAVGIVGSQVISIIIAVESGSLQSRILVNQSAGSF